MVVNLCSAEMPECRRFILYFQICIKLIRAWSEAFLQFEVFEQINGFEFVFAFQRNMKRFFPQFGSADPMSAPFPVIGKMHRMYGKYIVGFVSIGVAIVISGAVSDKFVNPITIAITTTIASLGTSRRRRLNLLCHRADV